MYIYIIIKKIFKHLDFNPVSDGGKNILKKWVQICFEIR